MDRRTFLAWMSFGGLAIHSFATVRGSLASNPQQNRNGIIFYIAPEGNDTWSGKLAKANETKTDGPFATLSRSRDAIRELKHQQGGILKQPVTVFLRGGTYYLEKPFLLEPEDSGTAECPVIFEAFPNEIPILSGGKQIENWRKLNDHLWVATLPDVKAGKWYFRLLRTDGKEATRARYPKFDSKEPILGGWLHAQWGGKPWEKGAFNSAVSLNKANQQLEWKIVVPDTGDYKIWVRYTHNIETNQDDLAILRADSSQSQLKNLPPTKEEDNYQWAMASTIRLRAGEQSLIWENLKDGRFKLDAFCLTNDPEWNPETAIRIINWWAQYELQPPKANQHLLLIQAEACDQIVGKEINVPKPEVPGLRDRIFVDRAKFPQWQNWEGAEVHIFPAWGWVNTILPVQSIDKESQTLFVNSQQDIRPGNRFFITNVREALDTPGEWYLDANTGELIYWPTQPNFPNVNIVAPQLDRLIVLKGDWQTDKFVQHIYFRGLTLSDTNYTVLNSAFDRGSGSNSNYYEFADAAIWLSSTQKCIIENCTFFQLGGYAVRLENRCLENEIISNKMSQLGQGGVVLLGTTETQPFNNLIAANDIQDCGLIYKHIAGVYVTTGSNNRIIHNRIQRFPRYGISLKTYDENRLSHNNLVEFNEIVDTNQETNDTGAIETLGRDRQLSGNIIRFNLIRHTPGIGTNSDGEFIKPYMSSGVFLDDHSSGTMIYGNIIVGIGTGAVHFSNGKNNTFENNIFWINGSPNQINCLQRDDLMKGNIFRHNIVVVDNPNAKLWKSHASKWNRNTLAEVDFNLYWHVGGLDLAKTSKSITPEGNFAQWQAAGFDRNSLIADPQFLDPEKNNYHLSSNSPAFQLGFQQIPLEKIGPQGFLR
ncbi:MAG TPA: right-handed parallel beta-helix repeat-containing protein [Leptolyngbyaceae cyanobacterium]